MVESLTPPEVEDGGANGYIAFHHKDGHINEGEGDAKPNLHLEISVEQEEKNHPGDGDNSRYCEQCEDGECDGTCELASPTARPNVVSIVHWPFCLLLYLINR
jgi:hypothetical protein